MTRVSSVSFAHPNGIFCPVMFLQKSTLTNILRQNPSKMSNKNRLTYLFPWSENDDFSSETDRVHEILKEATNDETNRENLVAVEVVTRAKWGNGEMKLMNGAIKGDKELLAFSSFLNLFLYQFLIKNAPVLLVSLMYLINDNGLSLEIPPSVQRD